MRRFRFRPPGSDEWGLLRVFASAVAAMLFALYVSWLGAVPPSLSIGYPAFEDPAVAWMILYAGTAAALLLASGRRSVALGALTVAIPVGSLIRQGRIGTAVLLAALVATATTVVLASGWKRNPLPRALASSLGVLAIALGLVSFAFTGRSLVSMAAALSPSGDDVFVVVEDGRADRAVVVAGNGSRDPDLRPLRLIAFHRSGFQSWRPFDRARGAEATDPRFTRPFDEECQSLFAYRSAADRSGMCLMNLGQPGADSAVLAGLAPGSAVRAELTLSNGDRIEQRLHRGTHRAFAFWDRESTLRKAVRVAFWDGDGQLLDARMGPFFSLEAERFARRAAGCSDGPCGAVNDARYVVSLSVLRPPEFEAACGIGVDLDEWVVLASVYPADHEDPVYARESSDRRLIGADIVRFWSTQGGRIQALPATSEPCFPPSANQP